MNQRTRGLHIKDGLFANETLKWPQTKLDESGLFS